jgi:hypothetical protein
MPRDVLSLQVDLDRGVEPISGMLRDEGGTAHRFSGVLGLIALLDEVRSTAPPAPSAPPPEPRT